jgi:hypothetical protein
MSNITILAGHDGYRFIKALTKKQKQTLSVFEATVEIVKSIKEICLRSWIIRGIGDLYILSEFFIANERMFIYE